MCRPLLVVLLCWLPASLAATAPDPASLGSLTAELRAAVGSATVAEGFVGAYVVALGQRDEAARQAGTFGLQPYAAQRRPELFAVQADKLLAPASTLKCYTVAAALDALGAEHTFVTRVLASAAPAAGAVEELYLVGGGDPSLGRPQLGALAAAVAAAGVQRIGRVIVVDSRYRDRFGYGWTVDDLPWYYAAECSALTLDRNHVDVTVTPGAQAGEPAKVTCNPPSSYLQVDSTVTTVAAGQATAVDFDRPPGGRQFVLRGQIASDQKAGRSEGMAVPEVELYAATVFAEVLQQRGVLVAAPAARGTAPATAVELARQVSPPLSQLIVRLLKSSDNLYAELLLRELGVATAGAGTASGGLHGVRAFLQAHEVDATRCRLADGSGLSRYNLVSARVTAGVLRAMALHRDREAFFAALPIAGVDGTLGYRFKGTPAERNVRAKTGSYSNHSALAGYVTTAGGDLLVASTVVNHATAAPAELRAVQDKLFVALAGWRR
ncbi:MAG: D-alanyl-D-alanine carboxypeptidase/D-alanyl-D-alanine-endopeptidase [Fimbriimonadaceae bacterium]|nr:D-alanyl-D-alanine carboxypeptidase/D-alanyl-D-alanine-endopeptidase [Fimbriimonadaceae bacterium]